MQPNRLPAIILWNIAGLYTYRDKTKVDHQRISSQEERLDIIAITETHLNEDVLSAEVAMRYFHLYRVDRVT